MDNNWIALVDQEGSFSYAQVQCYAQELAKRVRNLGIPSGGVVAMCGSTQRLQISLVYATQMLGCPLLSLSPHLPLTTLVTLLTQTKAHCLVTDINAIAAESLPVVVIFAAILIKDLTFAASDTAIDLTHSLASSAVQLIVATSGSEGDPKAVMLTGRNIAAAISASNDRIPLNATDRWLLCLPLYHIGGLAILHRCAAAKATVVIPNNVSGDNIAAALIKHDCTHVSLVPALLARLLEVLQHPPAKLRCVLVGGAALHRTLAHKALVNGWPLCISYGMSETCSQIATLCYPELDWAGQQVVYVTIL